MVRRALAAVLIGLGVFGLLLAVLLPTVVVSKSKKTPLDLNITLRSDGAARLYDQASGQTHTVQLRATRVVRSDSHASDSKYTTVNESLCIVVVTGDTPDCVAATDGRLLSVTTDRVTTDRRSGESVNMPKYGGNVNGNTSVQRQGMAYKWPIDAKKRTYQFFNPDLEKAFPATFQGTSKINGLTVYEYVCATGDQSYQVNGLFPGTYNDTRTVYVEPRTGAIIKGVEHQVQTLEGGPVVLDTTLTFDQASIKYQSDYAKHKIDQLRIVQLWAPLGCGIAGVALLVVGILLAGLRRGGSGSQPQPAHAAPPGGPGLSGSAAVGGADTAPIPPIDDTTQPIARG